MSSQFSWRYTLTTLIKQSHLKTPFTFLTRVMSQLDSPYSSCTHEEGLRVVDRNSPNFGNIAAEIYLKVVEHFHTARDLASLSKTCRRFRDLVGRDGWRVFVQVNFPSLVTGLPSGIENHSDEWEKLARSLTTQSRAWDRRAICSTEMSMDGYGCFRRLHAFKTNPQFKQYIPLRDEVHYLPRWDKTSRQLSPFRISSGELTNQPTGGHRPSYFQLQTTPFHPVIDTRLEFSGTLSSKKQTLVWSTGPEVFVQVRRSGSFIPRLQDDHHDHFPFFDVNSNRLNLFTARHDEFRSGIHDITSINILDPYSCVRDNSNASLAVEFIAGRASGHLHRYSVSNAEPVRVVINTFHSFDKQGTPSRRSVRSADVNSKSGASLLAACSDKVVSLYKTEGEVHDILPITEFNIELDVQRAQAWTARFSSRESLLLGLGHSSQPLHAYTATSSGMVLTEKLGDQCDIADVSQLVSSSVYAIEPLSGVSRAGGSHNGEVFLSGCYDGVCRLYDRRAGCFPVHSFYDPVDSANPIYSLASFGQERFLAGSARSILKIFDFRNGSKVYHYTDELPCSTDSPFPGNDFGKLRGSGAILNNPTETRSLSYPRPESCHHDLRTGVAQICNFHKLSRLDLHRPNTSIFIYSAPRVSAPHTRIEARPELSPVFCLSSPDPICPVVYAGATGAVYEFEFSEVNKVGDVMDPYFAAPQGAGLKKYTRDVAMYEMDGSNLSKTPGSLPGTLWTIRKGHLSRNNDLEKNESRLDARWRKLQGNSPPRIGRGQSRNRR